MCINVIEIKTDDKQLQDSIMLSVLNGQGLLDFNHYLSMSAGLQDISLHFNKQSYDDLWPALDEKTKTYKQDVSYKTIDHKPWHFSCKPKGDVFDSKYRAYVKRQNKKRFKLSIKENQVPEAIVFYTGWGHPEKIMLAISKKHPDVYFKIRFAEAILERGCGEYLLKDGKLFDMRLDIINEEVATKFAKNLWNEFD
ncbi:TPA: hypothetical protein ACX6QK_002569 [Photobacterium damselae]